MRKATISKEESISIKMSTTDKNKMDSHISKLNDKLPIGTISRSEWICDLILRELKK